LTPAFDQDTQKMASRMTKKARMALAVSDGWRTNRWTGDRFQMAAQLMQETW